MSKELARRYNKGKRRYDLVPVEPHGLLVDVYTRGAHKYSLYQDEQGNLLKGQDVLLEEAYKYKLIEDGADNWRKGLPWSETMASVERHIADWKRGKSVDPDLGTKNLANAIWGLYSLLEFEKTHPELDNRRKAFLNIKKVGLDIDGVMADFTGHLMRVNGTPDHVPIHWNDPIVRGAFENVKRDEQFWLDLPPLITREDIHFEPHCYITARSIGVEITRRWLAMHGFPVAPIYSIGVGESKVQVALDSGIDIFIDDSFTNFVELNKAGIYTYLYTAPYNLKYDVGDHRLDSLKTFR